MGNLFLIFQLISLEGPRKSEKLSLLIAAVWMDTVMAYFFGMILAIMFFVVLVKVACGKKAKIKKEHIFVILRLKIYFIFALYACITTTIRHDYLYYDL